MRDPDHFDAFYKDARDRLLLQTYALTGDLTASRAAVRDSFVMAWHHWRKVATLDDPEEAVRPHAWRHAQRRHTARLWHRDKDIDPEASATLDALGRLTPTQRRALLLTQLASVTMPQMAREIGLPLEDAERELAAASAEFSLARGIPAPAVRAVFDPLAQAVADTAWPRGSIIRRAGTARRRAHTSIGAAAAVAAVLLSGSLVTDAAGVRATLDRVAQPGAPASPSQGSDEPPITLTPSVMLELQQVTRVMGGKGWSATTHDNSEGNGLVVPCQQERYADPRGAATLVRSFETRRGKAPRSSATQLTELSGTTRRARRAFDTVLEWYAACPVPQTQLVATRKVEAAGDQAMLLVLRDWDGPVRTMTMGLARTGRFTTTTVTIVPGGAEADVAASTRLLSSAVRSLCSLPEGGECPTRPRSEPVPPPPAGSARGMLSAIDLPPVLTVDEPWIGTKPTKVRSNAAATRCDQASFTGSFEKARFDDNRTRTFLMPGADLPAEFGLTETVARLPQRKAAAFVAMVRDRLSSCEARDDGLGTEVEQVEALDDRDRALTVWEVSVQVTDQRTVSYDMAIVRRGPAIAQLSFVPAGRAQMPEGAFVAMAYRALDRLAEMPGRSKRP